MEKKITGLFIAIEGVDGAGKTTAIEFLKKEFESANREVLTVADLYSTQLGGVVVNAFLHAEKNLDPMSEALLIYAARNELYQTVILPALLADKIIIVDRWVDSTMAYQSAVKGVSPVAIKALEALVITDRVPDVTVYLDCDLEGARKRMGGRRLDKHEKMGNEFHQKVRDSFENSLAKRRGSVTIIDASQSLDKVQQKLSFITDMLLHSQGLRD